MPRPFIVEPEQVARMLAAAAELAPTPGSPLLPAVMRIAVVLLYTAGLRRGELLRLTLADVEPGAGVLRITESKFHKSRLVTLSPSAGTEFRRYLRGRLARRARSAARRPLVCKTAVGPARLHRYRDEPGIHELFDAATVRDSKGRRPRVHDIRHSFAVQALIRWYRAGADLQAQLAQAGDVYGTRLDVSTAYYLRFVPEVAALASARFENAFRRALRRCDHETASTHRAWSNPHALLPGYLPALRGMSLHTIRSYRDGLVLLLQFVARETQRRIEALDIADLTADRIGRFLKSSRPSAKTASRLATHGWPRSIRSLGSWSPNTRSKWMRSSAFSGFRSSVARASRPSSTWRRPRSRSCSAASIEQLVRTTRLCPVRAHVQHRCPSAGDPEPPGPRSAARSPCQVRLMAKATRPALPDLAADRELLRELIAAAAHASGSGRTARLHQSPRHRDDPIRRPLSIAKHVAAAGKTASTLSDKRIHPHSLRHTTAIACSKPAWTSPRSASGSAMPT